MHVISGHGIDEFRKVHGTRRVLPPISKGFDICVLKPVELPRNVRIIQISTWLCGTETVTQTFLRWSCASEKTAITWCEATIETLDDSVEASRELHRRQRA